MSLRKRTNNQPANLITVLLALCLAVLVACGGSNNSSLNTSGSTPQTGGANTGGNSGGNGSGGGTSTAGGFVYVANASNHNISAFAIGADGNLTAVQGSPYSTSSFTFDIAQANNTVVASTDKGLLTYSVSGSTGALTSTGTVAGGGLITAKDNNLYASGANASITSYQASNGTVTQVGSPVSVASLCQECTPGYLSVSKDGHYLFSNLSGFHDVSGFAVLDRGASGSVSNPRSVGGVNNSTTSAIWIGVHPNNRFLYQIWDFSNTIELWTLDPATGKASIVNAHAAATGDEPQFAAFSNDGRYLLVVNELANSISVFSIDQNTGALTPVTGSPFPTGARPIRMAFDNSGKYLYVIATGDGSADVTGYSFDNGSLQQVAHQSIGGDPRAIAIK